jgi:hypothetical protein
MAKTLFLNGLHANFERWSVAKSCTSRVDVSLTSVPYGPALLTREMKPLLEKTRSNFKILTAPENMMVHDPISIP